MGPNTKKAIESIVAALSDFPRAEHRQLLEWADLVASGSATMAEVEAENWKWNRTGTNHEAAYPNYLPDWSK